MGNLVRAPDNAQGVLPGATPPNCWPGASTARRPALRLTRPRVSPSVLLTMITQLNPRNLAAAVRERNEHLMNALIQADLRRRVGLDSRTSVVLYDANFVFNYALAAVPDERTLRKLFHETPVRYWSNGVQHTSAVALGLRVGVFCCVRVGLVRRPANAAAHTVGAPVRRCSKGDQDRP